MEEKKRLNEQGFSLIELIVVLVILGLLAGVVGPRLWNRVGQSKAQVSKLQIEQLGNALALFRFDVGHYPTSAQGLHALVEDQGIQNWSGPYLEKITPAINPRIVKEMMSSRSVKPGEADT